MKMISEAKKGFTVIEVALVLAIAGLIFMMVFVALPSLQRSQRDAKRREDILSFLEKVEKYQMNNRGALPSGDGWGELLAGFSDPNGESYTFEVIDCTGQTGDVCQDSDGKISSIKNSVFPNEYKILIIRQANCDGSTVKVVSNPRRVATLYKLEGAGEYCANI